MPLTIKHGSIFDSTAEVLVCPVNCVGVMGKGLALEFKRRFPDECAEYFTACSARNMGPGGVLKADRIAFVATKDHWRFPSNIIYVKHCLINIAGWVKGEITWDCDSIALPQLGCGCGGLDWADVWPLYEKHLGGLDCDVEVWIWL